LKAKSALGMGVRARARIPAEPAGNRWDEEKVSENFPKLAADYHYTDEY
jgi:hypothetical protein